MDRDTRVPPGGVAVYPFSGLLLCGDCGHGMVRKAVCSNGQRYQYYVCARNKREGQCTSHRLREEHLEQSIFPLLHCLAALLDWDSINFSLISPSVENEELHWKEKKREQEKYEALLTAAYGDFQEGLLDKAEYEALHRAYLGKYTADKKATETLEQTRTLPTSSFMEHSGVSPVPMTFLKPDRSLLVTLLTKICIFEGGRMELFLPNIPWLCYNGRKTSASM